MCTQHVPLTLRDCNNDPVQADIDLCLAPLIAALNEGGIPTASHCCGHGLENGHIWLRDGRVLIILAHPTKDEVVTHLRMKQ